ncbi:hypothetical protein ACOL3B_06585 [Aliarcobacter butzleri]
MNLSELEIFIDRKLLNNTDENRQNILCDLKNKKLKLLINNIINDEVELLKIAKQSYKHSNGFDKILLIDKRPNYALRLHLWNPENKCDGHIHNHEWDLSGIIIKGSCKWELYEFVNDFSNESFYCYECEYNSNYKEHILINEKKVNVKKIFDINISENSFYNLKSSSIHRIKMTEKFSASLILHGNSIEQKIVVINKEKIQEHANKSYRYYSIKEMRCLLEQFLLLLEKKNEN